MYIIICAFWAFFGEERPITHRYIHFGGGVHLYIILTGTDQTCCSILVLLPSILSVSLTNTFALLYESYMATDHANYGCEAPKALLYYHWANFANLTSFANFVAAASNLEIIPKFKLWYYFNIPKDVCPNFIEILNNLWMIWDTGQWVQNVWLCTILHVIRYTDRTSISEY